MVIWEYGLLVRRRLASVQDTGWEVSFAWYGPDGSMVDLTPYGDTAVFHLNQLGAQGWELVTMTEDHSLESPNELHRYHVKRLAPTTAPRQRIRGATRARQPRPR